MTDFGVTVSNDEKGALYGPGPRRLQDRFDSRKLADRLVDVTVNETIEPRVKRFMEQASYFYLSTVDLDGFPDVSYKGGRPGFVRVVDETTFQFPNYDGNGMYRSLGNITDTAKVALLFIRQNDRPARLRVHGTARVLLAPEDLANFESADAVVEIKISRVFFNCPRYVHNLVDDEISEFAPGGPTPVPEPEWKQWDTFRDVLPRR